MIIENSMYAIELNKYAQKCQEYRFKKNQINSHSISYHKCNFRCVFCEFKNKPKEDYKRYLLPNEFSEEVKKMLFYGKSFKFTGGEPTLNPNLMRDLSIVKNLEGEVYLDSNGSLPKVIMEVLKNKLVDVLGISLKGIDKSQSLSTANITNSKLVWKNVFETINYACSYSNVRTIVTYVVNRDTASMPTLCALSNLLETFPNLYLKINNTMEYLESQKNSIFPVNQEFLLKLFTQFIENNAQWKGRSILINSNTAMDTYDDIVFL